MSGRCFACNEKMTDFEMTRKYPNTMEYVGLCNNCFSTISDLPTEERVDLMHDDYTLENDNDLFNEDDPF